MMDNKNRTNIYLFIFNATVLTAVWWYVTTFGMKG